MVQKETTQEIIITRDGYISKWETMKPIYRAKLVTIGRQVDYFFTRHEWPTAC